jgi:hypothetical protein
VLKGEVCVDTVTCVCSAPHFLTCKGLPLPGLLSLHFILVLTCWDREKQCLLLCDMIAATLTVHSPQARSHASDCTVTFSLMMELLYASHRVRILGCICHTCPMKVYILFFFLTDNKLASVTHYRLRDRYPL